VVHNLQVAIMAMGLIVLTVGCFAARIGDEACLDPAGLRTHTRYVDWGPADNAVVKRNPPPLTWPWDPGKLPARTPGKWRFRLTVARDVRLLQVVHQDEVDFNVYAMLPVLKAGRRYFWQVQWLNEKGNTAATSTVRSFRIAPDADSYDLSILHDLPTLGHPRFICRPADLPAIRAARSADSAFGRAAQATRARADKIAAKGTVANPDELRTLAAAHLVWGDVEPRYAQVAVPYLVKLCEEKANRPETMPAGSYYGIYNSGRMFECYDWLYDAMTQQQREVCAAELAARAVSLCRSGRSVIERAAAHADGSHQMEWLTQGTAGAWCLYEEHPELKPYLLMAVNYWLGQPGPYSQGEGWVEGPGYGRSHLMYVAQEVLAPLQVGLGIPVSEYGRWGNIARFFAQLTPIGEDREHYGDGGSYWHKGWQCNINLLATTAGDAESYTRFVLKGHQGYPFPTQMPTRYYYFAPPPQQQLQAETRLLAEGSGFVVAHSNCRDAAGSVGFSFKCSPLGWTNHCLPEQGSFCLYAWGEELATNTGSYGKYGSAQDVNFNKHTISKNSLLINGHGQAHCRAENPWEGRIVAYHADDDLIYCCGSFGNCYPPAAHVVAAYRHFLFVRRRYFVIFDDVVLTEPGTVAWLYHLPTDCVVDRLAGGALDYHSNDVAVAFRMPRDGIRSSMSDRAVGADGNDYTEEQIRPATHLRFETTSPDVRQQFLTVIIPYRATSRPVIRAIDRWHVEVTVDGVTDRIGFGPAKDDTVDYEAIQKAAMRRGCAGAPRRSGAG